MEAEVEKSPAEHDRASRREAIRLVFVPRHGYGIVPAPLRFAFLWASGLCLLTFLVAAIYGADRVCVILCILCPVLMGVFWLATRLVIRRFRNQAGWQPIEGPEGNAGSARLVCHGDAIELERICALNGYMSEPYIAMRELPILNVRTVTVGAGACVGGVLLTATVGVPGGSHFVVPALVVAALWAYTKWCPAYYRVSPGRIEVLKFPAFGSRGRVAEFVDLTRARVICRYDQRRLDIAAQGDKAKTTTIDLWALSAPHEFAEAVFRGCLCTTQAPRLPQDELLG